MRFAPYLPLVALLAEVPWCVVVFVGILFVVGDQPVRSPQAMDRAVTVAAVLPAVVGLAMAVSAIAFGLVRRPAQWACWILGSIGCAACVAGAAWGLARSHG